MRLRNWIKSGLCLLLSVSLVACAGNSGQTGSSETGTGAEGPKNKVEIRYSWWGSTPRHELYNKLLDMFEQSHPHIAVIREPSTMNDHYKKLSTQSVAKNEPDVLQFTLDRVMEYINRGVVLPLDDFISQGIINVNDMDPNLLKIGTVDGKLYFLAKGVSAQGIFVNTDLLARKGIDAPPEEQSFEQWTEYLIQGQQKLNQGNPADKIYMIADTGGQFHSFEAFVRTRGKKLLSDDKKGLGFSKDDLHAWYQWWDTLRKAGALPTAEITAELGAMPPENSMLVKKKVAIQYMSGNQLKIFQANMDDHLKLYRYPVNVNGPQKYGDIFTGAYLGISKNSKHPEAVAELIDFWINDLEFNRVFNFEQGVSGNRKMNEELGPTMDPSDKQVVDHLNAVLRTAPPTEPRPEGIGPVMEQLIKGNTEIAFGVKTIEQVVDEFFAESARLLQ